MEELLKMYGPVTYEKDDLIVYEKDGLIVYVNGYDMLNPNIMVKYCYENKEKKYRYVNSEKTWEDKICIDISPYYCSEEDIKIVNHIVPMHYYIDKIDEYDEISKAIASLMFYRKSGKHTKVALKDIEY